MDVNQVQQRENRLQGIQKKWRMKKQRESGEEQRRESGEREMQNSFLDFLDKKHSDDSTLFSVEEEYIGEFIKRHLHLLTHPMKETKVVRVDSELVCVGANSMVGKFKRESEDRVAMLVNGQSNSPSGKSLNLLSLFDGHGGSATVQKLQREYHEKLRTNLEEEKDIIGSIEKTHSQMDLEILSTMGSLDTSGSCSLTLLDY